MGDVINLNRARKARARSAERAAADANRAKFGRTAAERKAEAQARDRIAALLDGARREEPAASGTPEVDPP